MGLSLVEKISPEVANKFLAELAVSQERGVFRPLELKHIKIAGGCIEVKAVEAVVIPAEGAQRQHVLARSAESLMEA
jgi:hypothetical protein